MSHLQVESSTSIDFIKAMVYRILSITFEANKSRTFIKYHLKPRNNPVGYSWDLVKH